MFLFGDVFTELKSAMRAENNPKEQEKALRRANMKLREIAKLDSWAEMREVMELSYTGSAVQLPSNLLGIDLVWDDMAKPALTAILVVLIKLLRF